MPQANITREVLRWARRRKSLTADELGKKVGVSASRISAWESEHGADYPTIRQAKTLAATLSIPIGYLFSSSPPALRANLPDLRTVSGEAMENPSPDFVDQLYDVLRKRDWYREHLESEPLLERIAFVGRFDPRTPPKIIAADIADVLGIAGMRASVSNWDSFLTAFVRKAEAVGVLVFRSGVVESNNHRPLNVREFRGFAISDQIAPLVFINSKDAKVAQIFTLAHELAHLWIGASGVSNPDYALSAEEQVNPIDRVCDKVAVELLVPEDDFLSRWDNYSDTRENVGRLARHYRVSRFVVLRRASETEKITRPEYDDLYQEFISDYHEPSGEGGSFYNLFLARNSSTVTYALLAAAVEGKIDKVDAARLLHIRVQTIEKARQKLGLGQPSG